MLDLILYNNIRVYYILPVQISKQKKINIAKCGKCATVGRVPRSGLASLVFIVGEVLDNLRFGIFGSSGTEESWMNPSVAKAL